MMVYQNDAGTCSTCLSDCTDLGSMGQYHDKLLELDVCNFTDFITVVIWWEGEGDGCNDP